MRHLRFFLLLAVVLALAAGCGGSSGSKASLGSNDVAVVGGDAISKTHFDQLMKQAQRSYKAQKRTFPKAGTAEFAQLRTQALQFLVQRAEFEQEAKGMGVDVNDKQVESRLTQIKKQYFGGNDKRYKKQLAQQGLTDESVHADIRAQLISEGIFKKVTNTVKVSDDDVKKYYASHKSQYGQPASRDVRHILVKNKARAFEIYKQVRNGGDFAALAKKYSIDPGSKAQGGKLTVSKGQTVPQFDRVAFSLKVNEVSPPVQTQYGWHVIQALGPVKPAKTTALKQVKDAIKQQLLQTKRNEAMTKWVNDIKKKYASRISYQTGYAPATTSTSVTTTG